MKILYLIPARGGSKRLPDKNIKLLNGKPLICYSIDAARDLADDNDICVTTDSIKIKDVVENYGLEVPFIRPANLASDTATTKDVILHALNYYKSKGVEYDFVMLLQPTSPIRKKEYLQKAIELYEEGIDMVVSVKRSHSAAVLCSENDEGFLEMTLNKYVQRSQEIDSYYEYNGSIYFINVPAFIEKGLKGLKRKKKIVMSELYSIDIDTAYDFELTEFFLKNKN